MNRFVDLLRLAVLIPGMLLLPDRLDAAPFSCLIDGSATPVMRIGSSYERAEDRTLTCFGGEAPPLNSAPSIIRLKLLFNRITADGSTGILQYTTSLDAIPISSRILDQASRATEAFAVIDDPIENLQVVCQTPATPNACPGANVFPGILGNGGNELFWDIPLRPPGDNGVLLIRLNNLRLNLLSFPHPAASQSFLAGAIISVSGTGAPAVSENLRQAGSLDPSRMSARVTGVILSNQSGRNCSDPNNRPQVSAIQLRLSEGSSPSNWKRRTDARPAPGVFLAPAPAKQTQLGTNYGTESGFYNPAFPGVYAAAGLADHGTRFYLRFFNVPPGVNLATPEVLTISTANVKIGAARRITTGADGAGAFTSTVGDSNSLVPMVAVADTQQAVYEIVETDITASDEIEFAVTVTYQGSPVPLTGIRYDMGFAPLKTASSVQRFNYPLDPTGVAIPEADPCSGDGWIAPPPSSAGLSFVPVKPCRLVDTRETIAGGFGKPALAAGTPREFVLPSANCGLPATAKAYSLNFTVVPQGSLGYITTWPTGTPQPFVSTLNSLDGRVKANAAIVPAGTGGAISVAATDPTELVVDVNGYFVPSVSNPQALAFYPLRPCRITDTREQSGAPAIADGATRSFSVLGSNCGVPASAQAYSLNATVVPKAPLGYLTLWPAGDTQPFVSTLNSPKGEVVANAAIVPAGTNGSVSVFAQGAETHLVLDINGYFAPPGAIGAQRFFPVQPCRLLDTRLDGPFVVGTKQVLPLSINCGLATTAAAYALNVTVPVPGALGYLTIWPSGQAQPFVSTLNAVTDRVVANAAIVPAGTFAGISFFLTNVANVVLDINGFFAP